MGLLLNLGLSLFQDAGNRKNLEKKYKGIVYFLLRVHKDRAFMPKEIGRNQVIKTCKIKSSHHCSLGYTRRKKEQRNHELSKSRTDRARLLFAAVPLLSLLSISNAAVAS